jgi:hypothetical protein
MAYLNPDPIRTVGHLLGCDSGWPDSLRFAVDARLPVLAKANLDVIVTRCAVMMSYRRILVTA